MSEEAAPISEPVQESGQEEAQNADPWVDAKEAFEDPQVIEEPKEEVKEVKEEPKSQLEQGESKIDLEKLKIPRKYKPLVEEYLKPLIEGNSKQVEEVASQIGEYQSGLNTLVNVFKDIGETAVKNPEALGQKVMEYLAQHGQIVGIDPSMAKVPEKQRQEPTQAPVQFDQVIAKIEEGMLNTQDPREFISLQRQRDQIREQVLMNKMGQLFKVYHEQYIAPDKETLNQFKSKAEQEAQMRVYSETKDAWNTAVSKVSDKFSDFKEYEPEVRKILKDDPDFNEIRQSLNRDPGNVERREKLLERIYNLVSLKDKLEAKNNPKPKFAGLQPNSKHQLTVKPGGSDWDDIKGDPELGWS